MEKQIPYKNAPERQVQRQRRRQKQPRIPSASLRMTDFLHGYLRALTDYSIGISSSLDLFRV